MTCGYLVNSVTASLSGMVSVLAVSTVIIGLEYTVRAVTRPVFDGGGDYMTVSFANVERE